MSLIKVVQFLKGAKVFNIAFVLLSFAPASAAVMFLADTVPLTSVYALL